MAASELRRVANELGATCQEWEGHDEREVVTLFVDRGFFRGLGYGRVGEDVRLELRAGHGRADVTLRAFSGRPICLIEFKRPGVDLGEHVARLNDYARELLPDYAALTNGVDFWLFERDGNTLQEPPRTFRLTTLSGADARFLAQCLEKREVDLLRLTSIRQALEACRARSIAVGGPTDPGGRAFLQRFSLQERSVFSQVVRALGEALPILIERSDFTKGAFEFWRRAYARDLSVDDAPKAWRPLLPAETREGLHRFMFALETAYAILSRVILVKAMSDTGFPDLDALAAFERALDARDRHGALAPVHYVEALGATFDEGARQAFRSLFTSDIFDWWSDAGDLPDARPVADPLAEATIAAFQFHFGGLGGDLLGELYQSYFDAETRKALGEFYTPPEVVDFILTRIGYRGPAIRTARLLDPACGSGTFLIHAIRRYLEACRGQPEAEVLADLMGGLRIIGFDINPFACLMAQVNYAAQILPLYAAALRRDPHFSVPTIPVFRTDSLRKEAREGEIEVAREDRGQLAMRMDYEGDVAHIRAEIPVRVGEDFLQVRVPVPRYDRARERGLVANPEEYFSLLRVAFSAVRDGETARPALHERFRREGLPALPALIAYVEPSMHEVADTLARLRDEYEDGRFLKTLEDLALALVLKNDLRYDYVVGNPPYVRIQNIPPLFRRRWEQLYEWTEGNFDLFIPFIERGAREWLGDGGRLSFICSNRFMVLAYAAALRERLPATTSVTELVDLRDTQVFRDALNYPAIFVLQRSEGRGGGTLPVARVFADPGEGAGPLLAEIGTLLGEVREGKSYVRGDYADAFPERREHLVAEGWHLMPAHERRVFDTLRAAGTERLENLTVTESAGFAGYQTSADDILVLQRIQERRNRLLLRPRGGGDPVEIERGVLRPFLFGRDVERWEISWRGWFVIFPYAKVEGSYRLLPSREYVRRFDYARDCALIDEVFPHAWKYLCENERELRGREGGRYRRRRSDEHLWYGAAYPRSLEHYSERKLLLQVSSQTSDVALDDAGNFVFTAGGTSGVYGLRLRGDLDWHLILGLLNSQPLDFYLKHVSATYAGHSYSYGDQFLKLLPIRLPATEADRDTARRIGALARDLTRLKSELRSKEDARAGFPATLLRSRRPTEVYPLRRLISGRSQAARIQVNGAAKAERDGVWVLTFGRSALEFPSEAHVDASLAWLQLQGRQAVDSDSLMAIPLPRRSEACHRLLEDLRSLEAEIVKIGRSVEQGEEELNQIVADYYGLSGEDRRVIQDFLRLF